MGNITNYDVSGLDLGDGRPAPKGTVLRLHDDQAVRMGLKKPAKAAPEKAAPPATPAKPKEAETKPRSAPTRKRPAPTRSSARKKA